MRSCSTRGNKKLLGTESIINDFAVRCFRDTADADYLLARAAFRYQLAPQALWASLHTIEKYLKCILLLHRIEGKTIGHSLSKALETLASSKKVALNVTPASEQFIRHVDQFGECRYLEISVITYGGQVVDLDRVVWELRRFCSPNGYGFLESKGKDLPMQRVKLQDIALREGLIPQKYRLPDGLLEKLIDDGKHPGRETLLWQNGFLGRKSRRTVRHRRGFHAVNSPLFNHPEILDEVNKYVHIPKNVAEAYREMSSNQEGNRFSTDLS